jgi:hypothetical protein
MSTTSVAVRAAVVTAALLVALAQPVATASGEDAGTLRGVAHVGGAPAADADVAAGILGWAPAAGDAIVSAKADAEGRFALPQAPLGPIDVWVRAKGGKWRFVLRMGHPGVNDLDVDASERRGFGGFGTSGAGTITGTVTDKSGKALAGAMVGLRGDDATWVRTDEKGQFKLEKAGDGDGVIVRADGFRDQTTTVKLGKKAGAAKLSIQLAPVKPTTVHVAGPDGKALPGAWVVLGDPNDVLGTTGFSSLFPPRARLVGGWTDANGDARVSWGHTEDKTVATAYAIGFAPATKPVAGGATISLQLTAMRPARAFVTAKADGSPLAGVYVGLPHESDGGPDAISALPPDAERGPIVVGRTDEKGECAIPHLAEGVQTLRVVGEMKTRSQVRIERTAEGR